jgi:hypothetical protein
MLHRIVSMLTSLLKRLLGSGALGNARSSTSTKRARWTCTSLRVVVDLDANSHSTKFPRWPDLVQYRHAERREPRRDHVGDRLDGDCVFHI